MSKIVFFCIPAHGHTNPTLGVVSELVSRGHQVWYYSYHMMREKIESAGATFISCDDYDMEQKLSVEESVRVGKDLAFSTKILVDTTLALDNTICKEIQELKPDCIVADSMALWGKAIALKLGIPFVSSTTTFAFNQHSAKIMKPGVGELFKMLFSMPKTARQVKRLKEKGYPVNNVYTSPQFQPCSETFSEKYAFVGPCIRPATEKLEKKREKLIYISMGTVNNDKMPFYKTCISALGDTEYQAILSVGNLVSVEEFGKFPENISVFSHLDQIAVLQQADVFVSHAGMNSVSESLYFGVPLVMLPQTTEQKGVAGRVVEFGAGIKLDTLSEKPILSAINTIVRDSNYQENAKKIADGFQNCPGAKGAADKIIQVCNDIE